MFGVIMILKVDFLKNLNGSECGDSLKCFCFKSWSKN